jgi:hypothetical protein
MLDGFKFCHRCGKSITIAAAAPELAYEPAEKNDYLPKETEEVLLDELLEELPGVPPDADREEKERRLSAGKVFWVELLCYIPVLNFFLLIIMATSGREGTMREYARGKLLASMTFLILFLLAALTVVLLIAFEIIGPIYLGRWRS